MDVRMKTNCKLNNDTKVNYIKLGSGGNEAEKCFNEGVVYIGFSTDQKELFDACKAKKWSEVGNILKEYKHKKITETTNILKRFFEDYENTIWITFEEDKMYWCFLESNSEFRDKNDGNKVYKKTKGKWQCTTIESEYLNMIDLAGDLTQLHAYRGTSILLDNDRAKYVITKINGEETKEVTDAKIAKKVLVETLIKLVQKLTPKDFELLVELIFAQSGWKRISATGGTTKFHDGVMEQSAINERATIQVKSKTNKKEFEFYANEFSKRDTYDRFYYIYHSPENLILPPDIDSKIHIWGANEVCKSLIDAGLVDWLIKRVE